MRYSDKTLQFATKHPRKEFLHPRVKTGEKVCDVKADLVCDRYVLC